MPASQPIEIGIVLYPGAQLSAVLGLTDLFGISNRFALRHGDENVPRIRVSHWQIKEIDSAPMRAFDTMPEATSQPSALIVPPSMEDPARTATVSPYPDWLRQEHARGVTLGSVCAGAFLLAQTGLLDDRTATTHWVYADQLKKQFPRIRVDADRLVLDDGDIITAGGAMSWIDLGLKLLDRFFGATVMAETARMLLVDLPGREQRFYSCFSPRLTHGDAAVLKVQHWLQETGAKDMSLSTLAAVSSLEQRTFLRRFRRATGMTTSEYCQRLRVGKASELLQFGTSSVDRVSWEVGYNDPGAFRKVFVKIVGLTPSEYRQRFAAS
jgi:transcriptional regulator GlxA family with amidase domain